MNRQGNRDPILSGYRVLDLTSEKGMLCPKLLSDMGADVIRLEKTEKGSATSPFSIANNLGKRSVTLNLEVKPGQRIFKKLVNTADTVTLKFQPLQPVELRQWPNILEQVMAQIEVGEILEVC